MGVPRFFKWLNDNFPECLFMLKDDETFTNLKITTDSFTIDLNAIIHPECQRVYKYGKYKDTNTGRLLHQNKNNITANKPQTETMSTRR